MVDLSKLIKCHLNCLRKLTLEQQNVKFAKALAEFHNTCDALETNIVSICSAECCGNFYICNNNHYLFFS